MDDNLDPADFTTQLDELSRQAKLAAMLRGRSDKSRDEMSAGQMIGPHFVPASRFAAIAPMLELLQANKAEAAITDQQKALNQQMQQHAQQWRSSLPQAVAAQPGYMPPNLVMQTPEGQAGTPELAARPVTLDQVLQKTMAARGNPLLKNDAAAYEKYTTAGIDREDRQQAAQDLRYSTESLGRERMTRDEALRREMMAETALRDKNNREHQQAQERIAEQRLNRTLAAMGGGGGANNFGGGAKSIGVDAQGAPIYRNTKSGALFSYDENGAPSAYSGQVMEKKPKLTAEQQKKYDDATTTISAIDSAMAHVKEAPDSLGWKTVVPDALLSRLDPGGVATRAATGALSAEEVHRLSGAAVSPAEFDRLRPFMPSKMDSAEAAMDKMTELRKRMLVIQQVHAQGPTQAGGRAGPPAGATPAPAAAIQMLQNNPGTAAAFKAKYGYLPEGY